MSNLIVSPMLQSYQGPTDSALRSNAVEGYTQVSRIGESVINAFGARTHSNPAPHPSPTLALHQRSLPLFAVDPYEFGTVPEAFTAEELKGEWYKDGGALVQTADGSAAAAAGSVVEHKPHFYEWATAYVGMIAVQRKQRSTFRSYVAAETAAPVIVCCAGKGPVDEFDYQFAGVVRSNSVRTVDDGMGPTVDEYFTLTIGGPQTILNNSKDVIHPGDQIAWTFYSEDPAKTGTASSNRARYGGPRRVGIKQASFHDENVIGMRSLSQRGPSADPSTLTRSLTHVSCILFLVSGRALTFAKRTCRKRIRTFPSTNRRFPLSPTDLVSVVDSPMITSRSYVRHSRFDVRL